MFNYALLFILYRDSTLSSKQQLCEDVRCYNEQKESLLRTKRERRQHELQDKINNSRSLLRAHSSRKTQFVPLKPQNEPNQLHEITYQHGQMMRGIEAPDKISMSYRSRDSCSQKWYTC